MARLTTEVYPLPDLSDFQKQIDAFQALEAKAEIVAADGDYVGAMIRFQVADGYAHYLVIALDPEPVLQFVPFMDAYSVHPALIRGLNADEIRQMVDSEVALSKLFKAKKA